MQVRANKVALVVVAVAGETTIGLQDVQTNLEIYATNGREFAGCGCNTAQVGDQMPALLFFQDVFKGGHGGEEGRFQPTFTDTPEEVAIIQAVHQCFVRQVNGARVHSLAEDALSIALGTMTYRTILTEIDFFSQVNHLLIVKRERRFQSFILGWLASRPAVALFIGCNGNQ